MIDLAEYHYPITDLFACVDEGNDHRLSEQQLTFFEENGYLAGIPLLNDDQIDRLCAELAELMLPDHSNDPRFYEYHQNESADPRKKLFHALGAWRVSPAFHDLLFNSAIVVSAQQLLRGPVRFWHDQLFVKPAEDGAVVAWHQDYSYWTRTVPVGHLTCWVALDDSTTANGCVHYVPGSHKWDLLPRTDLASDMNAVIDVLTDEQKNAFKPVAIEMKKGHASFHHSMLVHGSYENSSPQPRRAAVVNMFRDGVRSDSDEPLLAGIPSIGAGMKIDGRFFPLLFPAKTASADD